MDSESINDTELDEVSIQLQNPIPHCPKCSSIPSIQVINKNEVKIKCSECKSEENEMIEKILSSQSKFIQNLSHKCSLEPQKNAVKFCPSCNKYLCIDCIQPHTKMFSEHKLISSRFNLSSKCKVHDYIFDYYCLDDKKELCPKCLNEHKEHTIVELATILTKEDLDKIKEKIQEAEKKITKNNDIKEKIIKNPNEKITEIEEAYNKNYTFNTYIISLVKTLVTNYEDLKVPFNYNIMNNIKNNSHFNLNLPSNEEDYNQIIDYFNRDVIIERKYLLKK